MKTHDNSEPDNQPKKTYRSPAIQVYGNIRTLTNNAGMVTIQDSMLTGNTKTQ